MTYEVRLLGALGITVAVETTVIFVVVRAWWKVAAAKLSNARCLFAGFIASAATIPYLWFVLPAFVKNYATQVTAGEIGVCAIEALVYYFLLDLPLRRCAILSLVANAASIVVGLCVFRPGM